MVAHMKMQSARTETAARRVGAWERRGFDSPMGGNSNHKKREDMGKKKIILTACAAGLVYALQVGCAETSSSSANLAAMAVVAAVAAVAVRTLLRTCHR